MPNPSLLQAALRSNAAFSLVSGLLLLFFPGTIAALLGYDELGLLGGVGFGLVVFSLLVGSAARRKRIRPLEVLLISLADCSWILGSLAFLLLLPESFSLTSASLVGGVAAVVGAFAGVQFRTLRRFLAEPTPALGKYRYCLAVDVDAPPDGLWSIVSNLAEIDRYVPSLASSVLREVAKAPGLGVGVGRVRECASSRHQHWAEEVTRFDTAERAFQVRFLTDEPGFPFPMRVMHGGWQVLALPGGQSRVIVWWSVTPKVPLAELVLVSLMAASVDREFPRIIERMAAAVTGRRVPGKPVARLATAYC